MEKNKRLQRLSFLNGALFLLGSLNFFESEKYLFAIIIIGAALINFYIGFRPSTSFSIKNYGVNFFNFIVAVVIAWDYIQQGTNYIQYLWMFIAFMYLVVLLIFYLKKRSTTK